jgi:tetratricopeptide (TPR) repeat protein
VSGRAPRAGSSALAAGALRSLLFAAAVYASFALLCAAVYRGASSGPFLSDDAMIIVANPTLGLSGADLLRAAFAPTGDARTFTGGNYAPLVHLAHAAEMRAFGVDTRGYHLVNVAVHALNATLLVFLLRASSVGAIPALLGGAFFALHPANVEAVAWISQLRTLLAMAFALAALISFRSRPLCSVPLFGLSLLAKATGAFALPMACAWCATWWRDDELRRRRAGALALWGLIFALYAPLQSGAFASISRAYHDPYGDLPTRIRSISSIAAHYLATAALGYGTSTYHEPDPVRSSLDPWWLAGVAAGVLLAWRIASSLRRRRAEAGWWLGALAAFAPVSQVFPLFFAMGDRHLYFMLPGLIGGTLLAATELEAALARRLAPGPARRLRTWAPRAALAASALLLAALSAHASARARLWQSEEALLSDAASQYPDGSIGHYVRAVIALQQGDREQALVHLRACATRGGALVHPFHGDPRLAPLKGDPRFEALLRETDRIEIEALEAQGSDDQRQLYKIASAHRRLGELDLAIEDLEKGLRAGGPIDADLLALLEQVRRERAGLPAPAIPEPANAPSANPMFDFLSGRGRPPERKGP